jgi:cytochrome c551/c552
LGHQQGQAAVSGRSLTQTLDCKSCHKEADKSVGPAFILVAQKYKDVPGATGYLSQKIIKGGKGVWGETAMAAHPNLSETDVHTIVTWVLSLAANEKAKKSLPSSGSIVPATGKQPGNWLVMTASYTDKGGNNTKALTGSTTFALPSNYRPFSGREEVKAFEKGTQNSNQIVRIPKTDGWFAVDSIDLTGVRSVNTITRWRDTPEKGYALEVRLDSPEGKFLGRGVMPVPVKDAREGQAHIPILPTDDGKYHKLYFIYKGSPDVVVQASIALLQFNAK